METKKLCVIGDPVEHSLSPVIHNAVLKQTGLPYVYGRVRVRGGETAAFLRRAAEEGYAGFNATMPHKTDLVELVDDAMSDDYAKLGGLTGEEDLHEPLKTSLKKRLPWLIILLFLGMGVSSVVGLFESVVSQVALIVCFQSSGMFGFCIVKPPFLCCVLSAYHNFARDASQPNPSSAAISSPCGVISTAIPSSSFPA